MIDLILLLVCEVFKGADYLHSAGFLFSQSLNISHIFLALEHLSKIKRTEIATESFHLWSFYYQKWKTKMGYLAFSQTH